MTKQDTMDNIKTYGDDAEAVLSSVIDQTKPEYIHERLDNLLVMLEKGHIVWYVEGRGIHVDSVDYVGLDILNDGA